MATHPFLVVDVLATEYEHPRVNKSRGMRESRGRQDSIDFDEILVYPLHVYDIEDLDIVIGVLELGVRRAVVPTEENHQSIVKNTALFLTLGRVLALDLGRRHPSTICGVVDNIILKDYLVVTAENYHLIAINCRTMECSLVW